MVDEMQTTRVITASAPARLGAIALLTDALGLFIAIVAGAQSRDAIPAFREYGPTVETLQVAGPAVWLTWLAWLALFGTYRSDIIGSGWDEASRVLHATGATAAVVGISSYLLKFELSRGFFALAFVMGAPLLLVGRQALRQFIHARRRRGLLVRTVLVLGGPQQVDELASAFAREPWRGYQVMGALVDGGERHTAAGTPILGAPDEVGAIVDRFLPDVLLLADGAAATAEHIRDITWALERHDIEVIVAPAIAHVSQQRLRLRTVSGLPLLHVDKPQAVAASRTAKRVFDIVGASVLLIGAAPLMAFTAFRIYAHDRGPILFRHRRVGRDGLEFSCLKFRTMVEEEELGLTSWVTPDSPALLFKVQDDPRVTKPGRFLRRYSLDELPQLVNVLRGQMSLVGPRPQVADEVAEYEHGMERRLLVRPGMTGLWQVSGRSDLDVDESRRLDLFYVDNWSMVQDIEILLRTIGAVIRSRGAY